MAVDFKALLSKSTDTIERPKPLPPGTYQAIIGQHKYDESTQKKTPFVRFFIQPTAPGPDIDSDALAGIDLSKKKLQKDYYLTADAEYRVKDLATSCGIKTQGRSLGEMIEDIANVPVIIEVKHRNSQDGEEVYNEVGSMKGA